MAPRKKDAPPQPVRRSSRIAASSRASSVAPTESDDVLNEVADREIKRRAAIDDLERKNNELEDNIERLTAERDRERELRFLQPSLRDQFIYSSIHRKPHPRATGTSNAGERTLITEPRTEPPVKRAGINSHTTPSKRPASIRARAVASDHAAQAATQLCTTTDAAEAEVQHSSTANDDARQAAPSTPPAETTPAVQKQLEHTGAQTEPPKPKSWLSRLYGGAVSMLSPQRLSFTAAQTRSETPQTPLGDLTGSRKRTIAQVETEAQPQPQSQPETEQRKMDFTRAPVLPSTPKPPTPQQSFLSTLKPAGTHRFGTPLAAVTPLTTISEHTENTEMNASVVNTDLNASTTVVETPARAYRTIAATRAAKREKEIAAQTPRRSWNRSSAHSWARSSAPPPREPNADARLEKLREYRKIEKQMEELKQDEEIMEMIGRPVKRVKLDDLVQIPHNRPGDPSSTFCMFEEDSDEEMLVDEDALVRSNTFQQPEPGTSTPAEDRPPWTHTSLFSPQPPPAVTTTPPEQQTQQPEETDPEVEQMILGFPSVGKLPEHLQLKNQPFDAVAAAKFEYGLQVYLKTGEVIDW